MRGRPAALLALTLYCLCATSDLASLRDGDAPQSSRDSSVVVDPAASAVYSCPMDPDVRSYAPGKCRRCGMALVAGVPEPVEFHMDLAVLPAAPVPGQPAVLQFSVHDPWKDRLVPAFNLVHERLFHAFVVGQDLAFFEHGHPTPSGEGTFTYAITFPRPGLYRVLGDFYPVGGTPQLASNTVIVPGDPPAPRQFTRDYTEKVATNLRVSLETLPEHPTATTRTQLRFVVRGPHGLEKYLGVWSHMLVAGSDLIDMMQFQSDGVVNTAHFDVTVAALE